MSLHQQIALASAAILLSLANPTLAQNQPPEDPPQDSAAPHATALGYVDRLPTLLDRQLFFGDPEIAGSQVSPDGRFVSFIKPYQGVRNIWIKGREEPWDAARPLTDDQRPVPAYLWSEDAKRVLYVQDKGGNENFHLYAVDPTAAADEATGVPPAQDLTPLGGVRVVPLALPEATPEEILIGLNDRDPALHDVYRLNLATGERELVVQNDANVAGWLADLDGRVRLAVRQTADGGTEILEVDDNKLGDVIYSCSWQETCGPVRFHKDGKRVYLLSNKGEDQDLTALFLMDAETGETTLVESDPEHQVDFGGVIFSDATEELIGTVYTGDRTRIYPRDQRLASALKLLRRSLPDGEISFEPQSNDDRWVKVSVSRDVDPGTVYLFDWQNNKLEELYRSRPELPTDQLAETRALRYPARDGLSIPAYLTLPKGAPHKGLALVVRPHGGPWARDVWGYDPEAQFLANRGYAVLAPNFRGSVGYGKAFLNAGNEEWGRAMQNDISDGVRYLVEQGLVNPSRVCIMGGSYGGYATLAGVTFTPELYACGVDIVGPSNLITLLNSFPAYWGPMRRTFDLRVGDPSTDEGRKLLEERSPLFSVDRIEAPLLVIQGANDPRVKKAEADQIVVAMRDKGLPVEYMVAPDEGHGFRGRENRLAMYARIEHFLADHLGGRSQESMAPDVALRLAEISVDVASVTKPKEASGLDAAKTVPLPAVSSKNLYRGASHYTTHLSVQGRELEVRSTRTLSERVEEGRNVLVLEEQASGALGGGSDSTVLDAGSLRPLHRSLEQGPAKVELTFGDRRVSGELEAGAQKVPIDVPLDAPVFGGDSALDLVLTGLPLSEGYRTPVRALEVGAQQRVRFFEVAVAGTETVEVPAGSFEAYKVAIEPLDGEGGERTVWVTTEVPRRVVRSEGKLPAQMGGGAVTTVLSDGAE